MCGICGVIDLCGSFSDEHLLKTIDRMTHRLSHRGPDDRGVWLDERCRVVLGHSRLAIIDISPAGHQPMKSPSERYVLTYNGEIYNFKALRRDLDAVGHRWQGESDTEVLTVAIEHWGLERTLPRLVGMFSLAVWDRKRRILYLARDRFGQKPLYYGYQDDCFVFASELKPFIDASAHAFELDPEALALFMQYGYVPTPRSIFNHIHKLNQASFAALPIQHLKARMAVQPKTYWDLKQVALTGIDHMLPDDLHAAADRVLAALKIAVKRRMVSDVPLGAFLSGGIDSSLIVALMQATSPTPVKTFSIGVRERKYNEAPQAKAVAAILRTDHTELYVQPEDFIGIIPAIATIYDEPFADSSQIPTSLLCRMARQHVTVALSGDGGDEMFGGYNRHFWGRYLWSLCRSWPLRLRRALARAIESRSDNFWETGYDRITPWLPEALQQRLPASKIMKIAGLLSSQDQLELYHRLTSIDSGGFCQAIKPSPGIHSGGAGEIAEFNDITLFMQYNDMRFYLSDDIMTKVDRASMASSLEVRSPFLDHELAALAWRLPLSMKIRSFQGKIILRHLLSTFIPPTLFERPKSGFGIPLAEWLQGRLRDWAESLLAVKNLQWSDLLNVRDIRTMWRQHLRGERDWAYPLWNVLVFQLWYQEWYR